MPSVTLEEAQARLPELIAQLRPGDELCITQDRRTIGRLTGEPPELGKPREPGVIAEKLSVVSEDDDYLEDFRAYMP